MVHQNYWVSMKTVHSFVFWISWLPTGLEIPSSTYFNCPFHADFKSFHFFIICWNLDWNICEILQGGHFKSFIFCWIKHLNSHEHYWAVRSIYECSWALMGTQEQLSVCCHGNMSAIECRWVLMVVRHHAHEYLWLLMIAFVHSRVLMSVYEHSWHNSTMVPC